MLIPEPKTKVIETLISCKNSDFSRLPHGFRGSKGNLFPLPIKSIFSGL